MVKTDLPSISPLVARHKIHDAIIQMGLSFADCVHLIVYEPNIETACWAYDLKTGEESICIGKGIAELSVNDIEMVIRHEFLHRSTYHGFNERFQDKELINIVQDICINRLLFEAYEQKMRHLSNIFYPDESKTSVIALADCSAEPELLEVKLAELWHYIWDKNDEGILRSINPTSLYYRLLAIRNDIPDIFSFVKSPFGGLIPPEMPVDPSYRVLDPLQKTIEGLNSNLPVGSGLGRELSVFSVIPQMIGFSSIERFLKEIQYTTEARAMNSIILPESGCMRQAYPMFPSRKSILYKLLDIEGEFGYYNQTLDWRSKNLKLGFYIDISGSMEPYFPILACFVRVFKAYPLKFYGFSTDVISLDLSAVMKGKIYGGGGTDFNSPILDIIVDEELAGGVLFTDGEGEVSTITAEKLKKSHKVLFIVYFRESGSPIHDNALDKLADRTAIFDIVH